MGITPSEDFSGTVTLTIDAASPLNAHLSTGVLDDDQAKTLITK